MNRLLRLALTWLLLVAMPLQGYAAGGMLFCGAKGTASAALQIDDSHHAPGSHADQHHHAAVEALSAGDGSNLHDVMHGTCSVCSSCCSSAALLSTAVAATADAPRALPATESDSAGPGRGTARLERPPRLHLA